MILRNHCSVVKPKIKKVTNNEEVGACLGARTQDSQQAILACDVSFAVTKTEVDIRDERNDLPLLDVYLERSKRDHGCKHDDKRTTGSAGTVIFALHVGFTPCLFPLQHASA